MVNKNTEETLSSSQNIYYETNLTKLLDLGQMAYGINEKEIIQRALSYAIHATKSVYGYLHFVEQDQNTIQLIVWSEETLENCNLQNDRHHHIDQAGVWADCARTGRPVVHNDFQNLPSRKGYPDGHLQLIRHASVPLFDGDQVRIVLGVANKTTDYSKADVLLMQLVGDQLVKILQSKQLENAAIKAKKQYDQFVKYIPFGIFRAHTTRENILSFEYVNQQFCEMLNLTPKEIYKDSNSVFNAIHPDDLDSFKTLNREVSKNRKFFVWEGRGMKEGSIRWLRVEARPEKIFKGEIVWHGVITDTTERNQAEKALRDANALLENRVAEIEQLQEKLREQAIRDYLTGLFNRRYLDETIEREIARAKRDRSQLSVVMIDIDHFKSINDTYGHEAGDIVLIELGSLLMKNSRTSDIACRHGGDEFVIVMPNASPEDALKRADEWRQIFEQKRFTSNERRFATTLSMGIASYPLHASSPKGLFQAADQALYQSKIHNNFVSISRRLDTSTLHSIGRTDL
jgi:diguanylate cyclase (GGDEF)-like protein/PAS domain S-box-containing protein